MKTESQYCVECLKFRQKKCVGKGDVLTTRWGISEPPKSGLNFCKRYEFDVRLYTFADGSGKVGTIKEVRKRQVKRDEEISDQETFDDFDLGQNLSSADFEDIII